MKSFANDDLQFSGSAVSEEGSIKNQKVVENRSVRIKFTYWKGIRAPDSFLQVTSTDQI